MELEHKWDRRFLDVAALVASWSKDPSTKCGAVIVRPNRTICSTGYNGFPRSCSDSPELYADRETKLARVVHAEMNAILHAPEPVDGYTMYIYPPGMSCDRCTAHIIQSGITKLVRYVPDPDSAFARRWADAMQRSLAMYREAFVQVVSLL